MIIPLEQHEFAKQFFCSVSGGALTPGSSAFIAAELASTGTSWFNLGVDAEAYTVVQFLAAGLAATTFKVTHEADLDSSEAKSITSQSAHLGFCFANPWDEHNTSQLFCFYIVPVFSLQEEVDWRGDLSRRSVNHRFCEFAAVGMGSLREANWRWFEPGADTGLNFMFFGPTPQSAATGTPI
ncbi:hypothetical protein AK812_SmicGene22066 [Symbiodinium microadriaticum]|uniref:Uncharacterized protein n=1 Tax=Symbiodinium microadriaticum TaxID=2951 RepID=A0A1Q9DKS8_SYMMI|nr:hypothetical protein AK812_SmicGene22066 [Symbiodinium microadriaticum]